MDSFSYWPADIAALNPHFGTAADLKNLSSSLHARDMSLMVDVVVNHVATPQGSEFAPNSTYGEFDASSDFHEFCWITDYSNQTNVEQCTYTRGAPGKMG